MIKSKNKWIAGVLIISVVTLITSVSYALWSMTLTQETSNVITTGCFKIEFQDANPIRLNESYPITNEEGLKLEPYTFTITNTCESYASYQINLEILDTTTLNRFEFVKNSLNEKEPSVLTNFDTAQTTLSDASTSKKLETGFLDKLESKTFTLRLWLDEDTPAISEVMNKTIDSKITIITSLLPESPSYAEVITNCSNNGYRTADCMLENSKYDTVNLAYDGTTDNNLRYIGANPNNYVEFNDELWRVIGVMNNIEDTNGKKDSRLKLIRDEPIGNFSWDTSSSSINSGCGVNEWSQADAMKLLNPGYESESVGGSLYWNSQSGKCFSGSNNTTTICDFSSFGLKEMARSMIGEVVWYTGSSAESDVVNYIPLNFYEMERGDSVGKICKSGASCNDMVTRTTSWTGYIGLMYPSDYAFAVKRNLENSCLNQFLSNWTDCLNDNWIYQENTFTISASGEPDWANRVFGLRPGGLSSGLTASLNILSLNPVLYLKSNIQITSGDGSKENRYQLELLGE